MSLPSTGIPELDAIFKQREQAFVNIQRLIGEIRADLSTLPSKLAGA